jgi:hypothetical protein
MSTPTSSKRCEFSLAWAAYDLACDVGGDFSVRHRNKKGRGATHVSIVASNHGLICPGQTLELNCSTTP